jgi:hypothetical protein
LGTPGTQLLKWQMANREIDVEKTNLELVWGQVRTQVIELYSRILFQSKAVEIHRVNLETTRQFFILIENRFQSRDHPILSGMPETHYLKFVVAKKVAK